MFAVFKTNEGGKWHVGTTASLQEAKEHIRAFAKFWPADYAILNQDTGEWCSFQGQEEEKVKWVSGQT